MAARVNQTMSDSEKISYFTDGLRPDIPSTRACRASGTSTRVSQWGGHARVPLSHVRTFHPVLPVAPAVEALVEE